MGQTAAKPFRTVVRKAGDPMNVFTALEVPGMTCGYSDLPAVHTEFIYPTNKRSMNYAICRCWQSAKFPICDNSHKKLQRQGCDCGPVMLNIRQAPSLTPVGAEWTPEGSSSKSTSNSAGNGPPTLALFGGAASVSAILASGAHALGFL